MVQHLVICLKSLPIQCCEHNIMYTSKTFDLEVFVAQMKYMKYSNHVCAHLSKSPHLLAMVVTGISRRGTILKSEKRNEPFKFGGHLSSSSPENNQE